MERRFLNRSGRIPMSPIAQTVPHILPDLRRYARALSGSCEVGDVWVAGCLELLLRDSDCIRPGDDVKLEMFRLLHRCVDVAVCMPPRASDAQPRERLEREILGLPMIDRQILLLVTLEGFSLDQAADLAGLHPREAEIRLRAADQKLRTVVSGRVLIIEDEPIVAMDLVNVVRNAGHVLTGVAPTNRRALELARDRTPDLILADVRLRSGDSG